jgi:phage gpG-like protein
MSDRLTIELQDDELSRWLNHAIDKLEHPGELLDLIGATLEANTAQRLDDFKADPAGLPWDGLRPSTKRAYQKKYDGNVPGSLLIRADQGMRSGLTHNLTDGGRAVEIGFDKPYAMFHEFGTKHMARRGLLTAVPETGTLGDYDREDVIQLIERYLQDLL